MEPTYMNVAGLCILAVAAGEMIRRVMRVPGTNRRAFEGKVEYNHATQMLVHLRVLVC